jgi:K+-sensing histidine kinase KdpD
VDGHAGHIEAANRETGGARFTVRIPLAEAGLA